VSYLGESFGDNWDVGVGAFGCGGTDLLVWATSAGITLTSLLRFRAWAVFCGELVCVLCQWFCACVPGSGATRLGVTLDDTARDASTDSST
jgi:hypothetical protein